MPLYCVGKVKKGVEASKVVSAQNPISALSVAFPDRKPGETYATWHLGTPNATVVGSEKQQFIISPNSLQLDIPVCR